MTDMTETDHDRIIRMEEKVDSLTQKIDTLSNDFKNFKVEYFSRHDASHKELQKMISEGLEEAKKASVKYADNQVKSSLRDIGVQMFAEKRVQTIVYTGVKIILIAFIGAILALIGFNMYD